AIIPLHRSQPAPDVIFFAHALLGPFDGNGMVAGESLHPVLVMVGALAEHFLVDHWDSDHLAEKVDHLLRRDSPLRYPWMTIRSKQWYTNTSKLPNRLANN